MTGTVTDTEWSQWLSTYGVLTAQSVLKQFRFQVHAETLMTDMHDPKSVYFHLLRVPFKQVFNGIVLAQASDYRTYAQKLFIDYFLSGANAGDENTPGANIRASLESERTALMTLGDTYEQVIYRHNICIAASQQALMAFSNQYQQPLVITDAQSEEVNLRMKPYLDEATDLAQQFSHFRQAFYQAILRIQELLQLHPTYHMDEAKQNKNKESLLFDMAIEETLPA